MVYVADNGYYDSRRPVKNTHTRPRNSVHVYIINVVFFFPISLRAGTYKTYSVLSEGTICRARAYVHLTGPADEMK